VIEELLEFLAQHIDVNVYDFVDETRGKALPYRVYDLDLNQGWVSVGNLVLCGLLYQSSFNDLGQLDCTLLSCYLSGSNPMVSNVQAHSTTPLDALHSGTWFKLICGASSQHIPTVRTCTIAFALAGADCIDIAADPAIIHAVQGALNLVESLGKPKPWLMVSLNDGEDPHFRKAEFDPKTCPTTCDRPCEKVCPANAIQFAVEPTGVIDELCYGCGRCLPICPIQTIHARPYVYTPEIIVPMVMEMGIDAIEIHTQVGRVTDFSRLWNVIQPWSDRLKLIAVSCPDGEEMLDYLHKLHHLINPVRFANLWQTDGRPMSGDIGDGATRACIQLGQKVLAANLPGFVQLAGGTNDHTVEKLRSLHLLPHQSPDRHFAGIAYGSYARSQLQPVLAELEQRQSDRLEDHPDLLQESVKLAERLITPLKDSLRSRLELYF
jgi:Fe-S-cluster-containing hydrogenase component 2